MGVDLFGFAYAATVAAGGIMGYAKAGSGLHFGVKVLLAKMGLSDNIDCRMCGGDDETMEHLLCECHTLARQKMNDWQILLFMDK